MSDNNGFHLAKSPRDFNISLDIPTCFLTESSKNLVNLFNELVVCTSPIKLGPSGAIRGSVMIVKMIDDHNNYTSNLIELISYMSFEMYITVYEINNVQLNTYKFNQCKVICVELSELDRTVNNEASLYKCVSIQYDTVRGIYKPVVKNILEKS